MKTILMYNSAQMLTQRDLHRLTGMAVDVLYCGHYGYGVGISILKTSQKVFVSGAIINIHAVTAITIRIVNSMSSCIVGWAPRYFDSSGTFLNCHHISGRFNNWRKKKKRWHFSLCVVRVWDASWTTLKENPRYIHHMTMQPLL